MKKIFSLLALALIFQACSKDEEVNSSTIPNNTSFETLVVPSDFKWSSSESGLIEISLVADASNLIDLEGGLLYLKDANDRILAQEKIANNKVSFNLNLPIDQSGLKYYLPATGEEWSFDGLGTIDLNLANPLDLASSNKSGKQLLSHKQSVLSNGVNILGNADFEVNDFYSNAGFPYNPTTGIVDEGKWNIADNDYTWSDEGGSKVLKATNRWTHIWQLHSVNAGDSIYFNSDFSGNVVAFLFFYSSASSTNYMSATTVNLGSNPNGIQAVVPAGATVVSALFNFNSNAWVDNAFLSNPAAIVDADGDGVADGDDAFPNDPTRAYITYFPAAGRQTLAFEDLWPSKGDYDFNNLIVNVKVALSRDASLNWVSADYEVALDAVGAGLSSGLAMRLVNANKQTKANMIAGITGDASADPDVTNGLIIFNNPNEIQSQYYTNTDPNQSTTTPDTAKFTINFSANDGSAILPDFYIFRSNERGKEVHLPGFAGTSAADPSLYNTDDDVNGTYKTASGLPWAMELIMDGNSFKHPNEAVDMIEAYPNFGNWANSGGSSNTDWYQSPASGKTIDISGN